MSLLERLKSLRAMLDDKDVVESLDWTIAWTDDIDADDGTLDAAWVIRAVDATIDDVARGSRRKKRASP